MTDDVLAVAGQHVDDRQLNHGVATWLRIMMKLRKFAALVAALTMAVSMTVLNANAEGTSYTTGLTTATDGTNPVSHNTTTLDKYLVMDINANVPIATFDFSIGRYDNTKGEGAVITAASDENLAVLNGVTAQSSGTLDFEAGDRENTGSDTAGEVKFTLSDSTVVEQDSITAPVNWSTPATKGDEKYAKKTLTLDFSTVQFTEPGVYRYLITETGNNQGITNDTGVTGEGQTTYRTLDVYVQDYADYYNHLADKTGYTAPSGKQLFIAGYVLYEGKHDAAPSATATTATGKSTSYTNAYATYDLTFSKTVTGNQGSKDKYFAFTVTISDATPGTEYDISYADDSNANTTDGNADRTISANPNSATTCITSNVTQPETLTVGDDGTVSQTFYLQHGQSIAIRGLAEGTKYTITEGVEDYTTSAVITGDTDAAADANIATNGIVSDSTTGIKADTIVDYTNDRSGVIPTGILSTVAGSAGLIAVGIAGMAGGAFYLKKKKSEEE